MTTEPTQTPRTDAIWKTRTLRDRTDDNAYLESVSLERDLALSTQRIAELESQLRTQATEHSLANRRLEDEIGRLQARVKQLEGALAAVHAELECPCRNTQLGHPHGSAVTISSEVRAKVKQALSSCPPAVAQPVERWAKEKAAHKAGKRIQQRIRIALQDWTPWTYCPYPTWGPDLGDVEYRILPDDDAPPVQTEEKPSVDAYISQLYTDWCECSPYGEQVPDEWPELMAEFVKEHAGKDRDHMAELIMEAPSDDSFEKLLLSIFRTSCQFVIHDLSNAVYDNDQRKLALIGLDERKTEEKPATVPLAVAEGQWISVSDRMPDQHVTVLTMHEKDLYPVCAFRLVAPSGEAWMREIEGPEDLPREGKHYPLFRPPTHWMPKPPPPAAFQASTKE